MRIALATTTIHVPHTLKLMRQCSPDVHFFIATDEKTPHRELGMLGIPNGHCFRGENWKCSEALGWNTIARRNIAFLEALAWGADVIYSWDDDNIPMSTDHFGKLEDIFLPFDGLLGSSPSAWFDPGHMLYPQVRHRGIPYDIITANHYDIVTGSKVGVAAGLVLGDPDIDATTRMEKHPDVQTVSEAARSGVVVRADTHTVFNTQNTAVIRKLIPAWFLMPGVGRHDDIYASLIVQRIARERDYHVHFGQPFTYQQRNQHDVLKDLLAEVDGMGKVKQLATLLDAIVLPGKSVSDDVRTVYRVLEHAAIVPEDSIVAAYRWLEDCEEVLHA